jgi:hypothetical protein
MHLKTATLTGMDETVTDFSVVSLLAEEFPALEWALLLSPCRQGVHARFPSEEWLVKFLAIRGLTVALHLCGEHAGKFLSGETPALPANLNQLIYEGKIQRLQINFTGHEKVEMGPLTRLIDGFSAHGVGTILQMKPKTQGLVEKLANHISILFDQSGGRGRAPSSWPEFPAGKGFKEVGYSGGLDPAILDRQLQEIASVVGDQTINIDIESRLRDGQDRFSLEACLMALEACRPYFS